MMHAQEEEVNRWLESVGEAAMPRLDFEEDEEELDPRFQPPPDYEPDDDYEDRLADPAQDGHRQGNKNPDDPDCKGKLYRDEAMTDISGIVQGGHGFIVRDNYTARFREDEDLVCPYCDGPRYPVDWDALKEKFKCEFADKKSIAQPGGYWNPRLDLDGRKGISNDDPRWGSYSGEREMLREANAGLRDRSLEIEGWDPSKCDCNSCNRLKAASQGRTGAKRAHCQAPDCRKAHNRKKRADQRELAASR